MRFVAHNVDCNFGEASHEEVYFRWWLEELFHKGLILGWGYQNPTFELMDRVTWPWTQQMKRSLKRMDHSLFQPATYTADFFIKLCMDNDQTEKLFLNMNNTVKYSFNHNPFLDIPLFYRWMFDETNQYCFVDTKGTFSGRGTQLEGDIRFPLNQKMVWEKHGYYINKVIPVKLFARTFTPARYLWSDKKKNERKINFKIRTIDEFFKL